MFQYGWYEEVVGDFHASESRLRICSAPARTSKSYSAFAEALCEVFPDWEIADGRTYPVQIRPNDDRRIWIVGPDYQTNKEFDYLWQTLVTKRKLYGMPYDIRQKAYSPKQGNMLIKIDWGHARDGTPVCTVIQGKSATNPESLQGEEVDLVIMSEAADQEEKIWSRYLATRSRKAIFPTTPKIKADWLRKMLAMSEDHEGIGIEAFTFTPFCNPGYDWIRFWEEHAKAESRVVGQIVTPIPDNILPPFEHVCFGGNDCDAMRDPWFAEQFGGKWTHEANRVIPFRWEGRDSHVLHEIPAWFDLAKRYVAVDYGHSDPTCVHWYAIGTDGTILIYREVYERGLVPQQVVRDRIHQITREAGEFIEYYVTDPRKPEVEHYLRELGLPVYARNKNAMSDRASGFQRVIDALSTDPGVGRPRLFVLADGVQKGMGCPQTIHEWKVLRRKEGIAADEWSTAAIAGADHAVDCCRYFLASRPPKTRYDVTRHPMFETHGEWARVQQDRRDRHSEFSFTGPVPSMVGS